MASRIRAINAYRPRVDLGKRAGMDDLVDLISARTGLNEGDVRQVLLELRDVVLFFNLRGQPVKLEGLGTYTPSIQLDGTFKVGHRADMDLKNGLNVPGEFRGDILNRENVGKTSDELVEMWNTEHPDDQVS
jgi:nucleoid DNA-binding protein